ncbi:hypothetical protein [Streptococcus sanguinis]
MFEYKLYIIISCVFVAIFLYERSRNKRILVSPLFSIINNTYNKYYENYFYRFVRFEEYPELLKIYEYMINELKSQGVNSEILRNYLKEASRQRFTIAIGTIFSFIISFLGLTSLKEINEHLSKIIKFILDLDWSNFGKNVFSNPILWVPSLTIFYIILIMNTNDRLRFKLSRNVQKRKILTDVLSIYDDIPANYIGSLYQGVNNFFSKLIFLKTLNGFNVFPKGGSKIELRESEPLLRLENSDDTYEIEFITNDGDLIWELEKVKKNNTDLSITEEMKFIFRLLMKEEIDIREKNINLLEKIFKWVSLQPRLVRNICKFIWFITIFILIPCIFILGLELAIKFFESIYIFIFLYLCYLVARLFIKITYNP